MAAERADLVECARLGRPVGLRGEIAVEWLCGAPPVPIGAELFASSANIPPDSAFQIVGMRGRGRFGFLSLKGVEDRDAARRLTGARLWVAKGSLGPLRDGEYYGHQIIGLDVVAEDGRPLGKVAGIFNNGAHDIYEVRGARGKDILIPAVDSFILKVDLDARRITVRLLEGMEEGT